MPYQKCKQEKLKLNANTKIFDHLLIWSVQRKKVKQQSQVFDKKTKTKTKTKTQVDV